MRSLLALVCGIAAFVALLLTVPVGWVATHVANEDGYVAFTEPMSSDPEFRSVVADYMSEQIVATTNVPEAVRPAVATVIVATAARVSARDGYVEAWNETQRRSHRLVFGDPRDLTAEQDATDRLAVDIGPLTSYVIRQISDELPVTLTAPKSLVVQVNGAPQRQRLERVKETPGQARSGVIAVGLLSALALLFARRRWLAITWLGVGAVAAAMVLKGVGDGLVPDLLEKSTPPTELARTMQNLLADRALASLDGWLVWLAIGGAAVAVAGVVLRMLAGRSRAS